MNPRRNARESRQHVTVLSGFPCRTRRMPNLLSEDRRLKECSLPKAATRTSNSSTDTLHRAVAAVSAAAFQRSRLRTTRQFFPIFCFRPDLKSFEAYSDGAH